MRRSRNLPLPAGRLDYIIFVSGIIPITMKKISNYSAPAILRTIAYRYLNCIL